MVGFPTKEWWLSRAEKLLVMEGCGGCGKAREGAVAWAREAWALEEEPMGGGHSMLAGVGRAAEARKSPMARRRESGSE